MKNAQQKINPAWTAIAAVLAFGSTPAMAQEATASPGPTIQAPVGTAPVTPPVIDIPAPAPAPTQTAPAPTVQPIPQTVQPVQVPEIQLPPVETQAAPAEVAPAPARAPTATARTAPSCAFKETATTADAEAAANEAIADTQTTQSGDLDALIEDAPVMAAEPVAAQEATVQNGTETGDSTSWGLIAGLIALLIGGIAAAMMAFRRRKTPDDHPAFTETMSVTDDAQNRTEPAAEQIDTVRPTETVAAPEPEEMRPAYAVPATATASASNSSKLEQMVAEKPSEENPFLTYRKRLNRAKFILRQREASVAKFDRNADDNGYVTSKPVSRDARIVTREREDA